MFTLHKLVGTMCLFCLTIIVAVPVTSHILTQIHPATVQASPVGMSARPPRLSVFEAIAGNSYEIFLVDNYSGQIRQLTDHFASDRFPALSPDGRQVAFVSWRDGNSEIYVIDSVTGALRNVSRHPTLDILPVWSPDGALLAFNSRRDGNSEIYLADVERGLLQNLTRSPYHDSQPVWLPGGLRLVFRSNRDGAQGPYILDLGGYYQSPAASGGNGDKLTDEV